MVAKLFYTVLRHLPLILQIRFVTDQKENSVFLSICFHLVHPELANIVETERVSEIEDQKDTLTASIIGTGNGSEPLLASSIPDLKFDIFRINLDGLEAEINSNGGKIVFRELILYKPHQYGRLSNS